MLTNAIMHWVKASYWTLPYRLQKDSKPLIVMELFTATSSQRTFS